MANEDNLKPFKKGQSGNPNGRPKSYVTGLKDAGYNMTEINMSIRNMLSMNINELKSVFENPNATILEKTVAGAMRKSLEKGSLYSIETLLSRVFGKPKETADIKQDTEITIKFANGDYFTDTTPSSREGTQE
jgi:Family of unknown function (DUF5681)